LCQAEIYRKFLTGNTAVCKKKVSVSKVKQTPKKLYRQTRFKKIPNNKRQTFETPFKLNLSFVAGTGIPA
jgi:hypothetical protein